MASAMDNWRTQIRKGYLELCILSLIEKGEKLYGFQLLDLLDESGIPVKEGTLYPLLNRSRAGEHRSPTSNRATAQSKALVRQKIETDTPHNFPTG